MNQNKLSFGETNTAVEKLVKEFNNKLVSILDNCDEPIVLGLDPSFWRRNTVEECKTNPVTLNIVRLSETARTASPVYSAASTQTIT